MARAKHKFFLIPDVQVTGVAERPHIHGEIASSLAVEVKEYRARFGPLGCTWLEHEIR